MTRRMKINKIRAVGFDLDGVIYFDKKLAPGAKEIIRELVLRGLKIFYITNNSSRTREETALKLKRLGIGAKTVDIFTSGYACASFLSRFKKSNRIFVLGTSGLRRIFLQAGLNLSDNPKCDFLVVGFNPEFDYANLTLGLQAIKNGAKFVACNLDRSFPGNNRDIFPGCGAIVAAIAAASGKEPDFTVGKPCTYMLELAARGFSLKPEEILIVGDSLETDIAMANNFGSVSVLISKNKPADSANTAKPTYVISSLTSLKKYWR